MLVIAGNPSYQDAERTFLTDPVSAGAVSLGVKNSSNYAINNYLTVGTPGQEKTELVKITAITDATHLAVTATQFGHNADDVVYLSRFNQLKIYRATASWGTFTLLTTTGLDVDNSAFQTVYDDTTGVSTQVYKVSYYNDVTTIESSLSDEIPGTGYGRSSVSYIISAIQEEGSDKSEQVTTRSEILRWLNDCNNYVLDKRKRWRHWLTATSLTATAGVKTVLLPTDLWDLDYVDYNYVTTATNSTYRLREISLLEMQQLQENNLQATSDALQLFTLDSTATNLIVWPPPTTTQTSKLGLHYYRKPTTYTTEGQTVDLPDTTIYENYGLHRFYLKKQDLPRAQQYKIACDLSVANLVRHQKIQSDQPRAMAFRKATWRGLYKS